MSTTFTRDQFRWLAQVIADGSLENLAFKIAYAISTQTDSRVGCIATCSHDQLSRICRCSVQGVRKAVRQLVEHKHLHIIQLGDGRSKRTQYSWVLDGAVYSQGSTTVVPLRSRGEAKGDTVVEPLRGERVHGSIQKVPLERSKGSTAVAPRHYIPSESSRSSMRQSPRPMVFVEVETPEWRAWLAYGHKADLRTGHRESKSVEGWYFPTQWPPGDNIHTLPSQRGNR